MTGAYPYHYNDVAEHFIRRFNNLANDIFDRIDAYERRPDSIDLDPNFPDENEIQFAHAEHFDGEQN